MGLSIKSGVTNTAISRVESSWTKLKILISFGGLKKVKLS